MEAPKEGEEEEEDKRMKEWGPPSSMCIAKNEVESSANCKGHKYQLSRLQTNSKKLDTIVEAKKQ